MKNLSNYFLGFVTFVFAVVVISLTCYLTIPNFKNFVDNLINPTKTEAYNLVVSAENASVKVMQGESEIQPGEKVLTAGSVYTITVGSTSEDYHCTYFYLNGVLYANGSEVVCESDFDISALVVGTYDLTISYVNCEGLEVLDVTNLPTTQPGVAFEGLVITPGENVLYKDQKLRFNIPSYVDKEFTELKISTATNTLIYTYEDLVTTTTYSVYADTHIELTYTDIVEEPVALPASYFTFNDGTLMGFSAEGQEKYDAGEIKAFITPSSYSLGLTVTEELTFIDLYELDDYCRSNGYSFSFTNIDGSTIWVVSEDRFFEFERLIDEIIMTNGSITITTEVQQYIDGVDFSVTGIGIDAFSRCDLLSSVVISDGVVEISDSAFDFCYGLEKVFIPEGVEVIGSSSFCSTSLKSVSLPSTIKTIGFSAFRDTDITSFYIPKNVVSLGDLVVGGCSNLETITVSPDNPIFSDYSSNCVVEVGTNILRLGCSSTVIPESVEFIGDYAFWYCSGLTSITIPNSVTSLGYSCFDNCTSLTSITIPDSVISLGTRCFADCTSLTSITIPDGISSLSNECFSGCTSLTSITIPSGVTRVGQTCFNGCTSLISIIIPESVTELGTACFSGCTSLNTITLPSGISTLSMSLFSNCTSLKTITIPSGVTDLYIYCFYGCTSLSSIDFSSLLEVPELDSGDAFMGLNENCKFVVPDALYDSWIVAENLSAYVSQIVKASEYTPST